MNLIDAAIDQKVKKVVALSTDKASSPINLYGATNSHLINYLPLQMPMWESMAPNFRL